MRGGERYQAHGVEAEFEPGSRGRVLRNLAGIRSAREMARPESEAFLVATERLIDETVVEQRFAGEIAGAGFRRDTRGRKAALYRRDPGCNDA